MTRKEFNRLLQCYDGAFEASVPLNKELHRVLTEASLFVRSVARIVPQPFGTVYQQLTSITKALPATSLKSQEAVELTQRLRSTTAIAKQANDRVAAVLVELKPAVEELNTCAMRQIYSRRSAMIQEITSALAPYCDNPSKARELAEQCDKVAGLEFEAAGLRVIHDLRGRASRLLPQLS